MNGEPVAHAETWFVLDKPGVEYYHIRVTFRAHWEDEEQVYEAVCDELDVASFGETIDEAIENVLEATLLYVNTIEELGERRRVFEERGITPDFGLPELHQEEVPVDEGELVMARMIGRQRKDGDLATA